jgi:nucleotide-binding universal stress UspA family protein
MTHAIPDGELVDTTGASDGASPRRTHTGPLLIAGEDADHTRGVLHVAELLARRDQVNAHVLGVVRPLAFPASLFADLDRDALEDGRRRMHLEKIRQRLHQATGLAAFFTVDAVTGSPAPTLARTARERGAELIMVALDERGGQNRTATEDAALQVSRAADTPVLAVPAGCALLPKNALAAMDFSPASQHAARAAIPLLAQGAKLTLVYVEPELDFASLGKEGWSEIHQHGVGRLFEKLTASLSVPGDVSVETVLLRGADPAAALLAHVRAGDFDLVATGTQGETALDRHLTGSVSTALLRGARCAVLIAPPPPEAAS